MSKKAAPSLKQFSVKEMEDAVTKIDRLIAKLKGFDLQAVQSEGDPNVEALEHKINKLLTDLFGTDSAQYEEYWHIKDLYYPSLRMGHRPSAREIQDSVRSHIIRAITVLETIKEGFSEEIDYESGGVSSRVIKAYRGLDLHPVIAQAANKLYLDEHYAHAVEDAVKALNDHVRQKSGASAELDGTKLMEHVFGPGKAPQMPVLKLNDMKDENDRSEQRGFVDLFRGAVVALRNPRAHKIIQDDPETALEYVGFISLLAKLVDKANK